VSSSNQAAISAKQQRKLMSVFDGSARVNDFETGAHEI
jgi:hypothetical protein